MFTDRLTLGTALAYDFFAQPFYLLPFMIRIIGGQHRGRKLATPKGDSTRPSSDFVREALFNILQSDIEDAFFLDLFAGSGAVGLEALSRGASRTYFVEKAYSALSILKKNVSDLGESENAGIIGGDVFKALDTFKRQGQQFNIIFADPPYFDPRKPNKAPLSHAVLELVDTGELLKPGGVLFLEDCKEAGDPGISLRTVELYKSRDFGRTRLWQYRRR